MAEPDMVDHPDVQALVTQARDGLAAGNNKEAARLLTDAAYHTHDPEIERQVRELGVNYLLTYLFLGTMSLAEALRSLELFRSEVMPHLAKL